MRDVNQLDEYSQQWRQRIQNVNTKDIWGSLLLESFAPDRKDNFRQAYGYSYYEEAKYGKKSKFLKNFYEGQGRPKV